MHILRNMTSLKAFVVMRKQHVINIQFTAEASLGTCVMWWQLCEVSKQETLRKWCSPICTLSWLYFS